MGSEGGTRPLSQQAPGVSSAVQPSGEVVLHDVPSEGGTLRMRTAGAGTPTVVFESGSGWAGDYWGPLLDELADSATVVSYDRAGLGASTAKPTSLRPTAVAGRLREALETSGFAPPYVLVGHSLGGLHVRAFAYQWPEEVLGLVLVDPSHERMRAVARQLIKIPGVGALQAVSEATGFLKLAGARLTRHRSRAVLAESQSMRGACAEIQALRAKAGPQAVPVIVLSATLTPPGQERHTFVLRAMHDLHRDLAEHAVLGEQRFVETAHAFVDNPVGKAAVVQAVRDLVSGRAQDPS
jgi:pimeloyl-ACP methyl ester carboxylesterase